MRIFISPLDWGLGHAARCVPVIHHLLEKNVEVIIGAEGSHLYFLREHFPQVEFVEFPGYRVSYSTTIPANLKVLLQVPGIISAIHKEHALLEELIVQKKIDAIISDNRYGLWSHKIPSVIITHQLNIQAPAGKKALNKTIHHHINHFNECWIPDYEGEENLSGALSHPIPKEIKATYIGLLSRFNPPVKSEAKMEYDLFVILSGTEPQRSILEKLIVKQLKDLPAIKALIIQGLPGDSHKKNSTENIEIIPHLPDEEFQHKLNNSEIIISRPGYSTIMDLHAIGWKKSIFIPTPGQTEQEYLGNLMQEKGLAIISSQKEFQLEYVLKKVIEINSIQPLYEAGYYKAVVDDFVRKIRD